MKIILLIISLITFCQAECISHLIQAQTEVIEMKSNRKRDGSETLETVPFKVIFDTSALDETIVKSGKYTSTTPVCFSEKDGNKCSGANILTQEKKEYIINKIIPEVKRNMELFFSVHKNTVEDLKQFVEERKNTPDNFKCGEVKQIAPNMTEYEKAFKDGVGMIMYVTAHPVESETVLAYAASCAASAEYDNPEYRDYRGKKGPVKRNIMGYTNINPAGLEVDDGKIRINAHTVLHETMHAMGFTQKAFERYIPKGKQEKFLGKIVNTTRVLAVAKEYFGDDSITYVEFEDGGGSGTAGAHWEKRLLYNEIMTGTSSYYSVISNFTLAFFHDLGTFVPNYQYAEPLTWGKGMKKDFYSCGKWPDSTPYGGYYGKRGCTGDRGSIGMSDQTTGGSSLPSKYQHYEDSNKCGMNEIMDYCVHTTIAAGGQCYRKNTVVDAISSMSFIERGMSYGGESRCLDTSLVMLGVPTDDFGCYNVKCLDKSRGYRVQVNDDWYLCETPKEGDDWGKIEVFGYFGSVKCLNRNELCPDVVQKEEDRLWPDITAVQPINAKIGDKIEIRGKHLKQMNVVYIGNVLQTTNKVKCSQDDGDTDCTLEVPKIEFTDIFVDFITLISKGHIKVNVVAAAGGVENAEKRQFNAVFTGFELQITAEDFFFILLDFIVDNALFVVGIIIFIIWIIFFLCYIITKRVIRHKAKNLAREYISY